MITYPANYQALIRSNMTRAYIVKIEAASNTYYVSNSYMTFDSTIVLGILAEPISIKERIDLVNSTVSIPNTEISIVNTVPGDYLSKLIQAENFINRSVTIYEWTTGLSSYSDCPVVFTGKIKSIGLTRSIVTLNVFSVNFLDSIDVVTALNNGVPVPLTYGDNTYPADLYYMNYFGDDEFLPVTPAVLFGLGQGSKRYYMTGGGATSGLLLNYIKEYDFMFRIVNTTSGETFNGQDAFLITGDFVRNQYLWTPDSYSEVHTGSGITLSTPAAAYDRNPSTTMNYTYDDVRSANVYGEITYSETLPLTNESEFISAAFGDAVLQCDTTSDSATTVQMSSADQVLRPYDIIRIDDEEMKVLTVPGDSITVERGFNGTTPAAHSAGAEVYYRTNITYTIFEAEIEAFNWTDGLVVGYITVDYDNGYDSVTITTYATNTGPGGRGEIETTEVSATLVNPPNTQYITYTVKVTFRPYELAQSGTDALGYFNMFMYSVNHLFREPEGKYLTYADGLAKSYSGGSGAASLAQEIIRDLYARYTDFDVADGAVTGWSDLATDRTDTFKVWVEQRQSLKALIERLQYEGRQIWDVRDSSARVIYVDSSYSSADFTFTDQDIAGFSFAFTGTGELESKVITRYGKNPQNDEYWYSATVTNADRGDYFGTNDGISSRDIEHKYGAPTAINSYYDSINGSPKVIVSFRLLNPVYFNIQTGDIVQIDSDVFDTYFTISDKYFMVTETTRTADGVSVTAREVG